MTEEELEQFIAAAHEFRSSAHYISALNKAEALDELINLVNAMLAKREGE